MYIYTDIPPAESLYCCSYLFVFRADHLGLEELSGKKTESRKQRTQLKQWTVVLNRELPKVGAKMAMKHLQKYSSSQQLGKGKLKSTWQLYFIPS